MLTAGQKMTESKRSFISCIIMCGELLSSLLFPPRCILCDEILSPEEAEKRIHKTCESKLYPIIGPVCMHCGRPIRNDYDAVSKKAAYLDIYNSYEYCYDCKLIANSVEKSQMKNRKNKFTSYIEQGKSLYLYRGDIKKTMYRFKYSNKREYAKFFAQRVVRKHGDWIREKQIQAIVPVPMYLPKERKRGYNQAKSFARELSMLTGLPVEDSLVFRVRDTKALKTLNPMERKNNLKNAFQNKKSIVQYTHILVVDDIYTTGSTAQAVAEELIKQGVGHVYFLSICIGETM